MTPPKNPNDLFTSLGDYETEEAQRKAEHGPCSPPQVFISNGVLYPWENAPLSGEDSEPVYTAVRAQAKAAAEKNQPGIQQLENIISNTGEVWETLHPEKGVFLEELMLRDPALAEEAARYIMASRDYLKRLRMNRMGARKQFPERNDQGYPTLNDQNLKSAIEIVGGSAAAANELMKELGAFNVGNEKLPTLDIYGTLNQIYNTKGDIEKAKRMFTNIIAQTKEWLAQFIRISEKMLVGKAAMFNEQLKARAEQIENIMKLFRSHGELPQIMNSFMKVIREIETIQLQMEYSAMLNGLVFTPVSNPLHGALDGLIKGSNRQIRSYTSESPAAQAATRRKNAFTDLALMQAENNIKS